MLPAHPMEYRAPINPAMVLFCSPTKIDTLACEQTERCKQRQAVWRVKLLTYEVLYSMSVIVLKAHYYARSYCTSCCGHSIQM